MTKPNKFLLLADDLKKLFKQDDDLWFREREIRRQQQQLKQLIKKKLEEVCQIKD